MPESNDDSVYRNPELGALLRLFSSLGITMAAGTVGFFLLGLFIDRTLKKYGIATYGLPLVFLTLFGVALSVYWCYLRINKHLTRFPRQSGDLPADANGNALEKNAGNKPGTNERKGNA